MVEVYTTIAFASQIRSTRVDRKPAIQQVADQYKHRQLLLTDTAGKDRFQSLEVNYAAFDTIPHDLTAFTQRSLAALRAHHEYSYGHSVRTAYLVQRFLASVEEVHQITIPPEIFQSIVIAALNHDIGKVNIPVEVLDKKGKLSEDERSFIATHTAKGGMALMHAAINQDEEIKRVPYAWQIARSVTFDHHTDPSQLDMMDFTAQFASGIVRLCDSIDAMASDRGYNPILSLPEIVEIVYSNMFGGRGQFMPELEPYLVAFFNNISVPFEEVALEVGAASPQINHIVRPDLISINQFVL